MPRSRSPMSGICRLETLPPEVEEAWVAFVPPKDLCNLMLTSTFMRTLASNPKLWSRMKVNKQKIIEEDLTQEEEEMTQEELMHTMSDSFCNTIETIEVTPLKIGLEQVFDIPRFSKIREIDLSDITFTKESLERNLNAIASSSVEVLNLSYVGLANVSVKVVGRALGNLHQVKLDGTNLTIDQIIAVLNACISSSSLVDVSLLHVDLIDGGIVVESYDDDAIDDINSEVPAELLGRAAGHLQAISLGMEYGWGITFPTSEQSIAVLKSCISSSMLEHLTLSIGEEELEEIPAELLGRAAGQLTSLKLYGFQLELTTGKEHCLAVLDSCISSKLVELCLGGFNLEAVSVESLTRAADHLQTMDLSTCAFSHDQILPLLETCITSSKLFELRLDGFTLKSLPAGEGGYRKSMKISRNISNNMLLPLFETCTTPSSKLVELRLDGIDLQSVPVELLVKAADHLKTMDLSTCDLTNAQILPLLKISRNLSNNLLLPLLETCTAPSSKLVELCLDGVHLKSIPEELLVNAVDPDHLKTMDLSTCDLTNDQILPLLQACISSSKMFKLRLDGFTIKSLPAREAGHSKSMEISHTNLSKNRLLTLLETCTSPSSKLVELRLDGVDLQSVPAELLLRAAEHLKTLDLSGGYNYLTKKQLLTLLENCLSSIKLVKMSINEDCLDYVEIPDIMTRVRNTELLWGRIVLTSRKA